MAPETMQRPPHPPGESVLARGLGTYLIWVGILLGVVSLAALHIGYDVLQTSAWQTMVFTVLALSQMGNALAVRSDRESLFRMGLMSNPALVGAVVLTVVVQLAVVYLPFANPIFDTMPLSLSELGISVALSTVVFAAVELVKWGRRLRSREAAA